MEISCLSVTRNTCQTYAKYFKHVDDCAQLYDDAADALGQRNIQVGQFSELEDVVSFNFLKATESLIALSQLCNSGLIPDARTICRKLIDQAVSIAYLSQDTAERLPLYTNFGALRLHSLLREIDSPEPSPFSEFFRNEFEALKPQIEAAYEAARSVYPTTEKGKVSGAYSREWSGKTFKKMAAAADLHRVIVPYKLFSFDTHSSIMNRLTYRCANEYRSPLHQVRIDEVPHLLIEGCKDYLVVATQANESLDLGFFNRICELDHRSEVLLDELNKDE